MGPGRRRRHRFNPAKLVLAPCARELRGELVRDPAVPGHAGDDLTRDDRDSAPFVPKAVVVDPDFDWSAEEALRHRWEDTLIWEAHPKGATMRCPWAATGGRCAASPRTR